MISIWFVCAHAHNSFSSCECPMCHAHSAAFVWVERIEIKTATTKYLAQAQRSLNVCCLFRLVTIVMTFLSENLNWKIAYTTTRKKWRKIFLYVAHFHWEIIEFGAYVCVCRLTMSVVTSPRTKSENLNNIFAFRIFDAVSRENSF